MSLFKFNWLYIAFSILIAAIIYEKAIFFLVIFGGYFIWLTFKNKANREVYLIIVLGLLAYLYFKAISVDLQEPFIAPAEMVLTSNYSVDGERLRGFFKSANKQRIYATYKFKSENEKRQFTRHNKAGMIYKVTGKLEAPAEAAHIYAFSMSKYLERSGAYGIYEIASLQEIDRQHSLTSALSHQRTTMLQRIEAYFPPSLVAEAQALILGEQGQVDDDMTRAYQKLGITHLFAISGLHIALLSVVFYQLLLRLRVRIQLATILLCIILPLYGFLAGGAASVWRAVLVVELVLLLKPLKLHISPLDALSISFIVLVLYNPLVIYQIGFQLSYLATLSLILSFKIIERQMSWWRQSFMITFVCQLLVYPVLLYHFYEISLSSFIVNIVFVPLFSFVILPINCVLLIATWLPDFISKSLFYIYTPLREWLSDFILWLQAMPYQMWVPGKPTVLIVMLLMLASCVALYAIEQQFKLSIVLALILLPAISFQLYNSWQSDVRVSFINVGQGDSILIELPYRRGTYLIDAGGLLRFDVDEWKKTSSPYEIGKNIVVPYLKGQGVSKLDILILTHADADHVEGADEVLKEIRVESIHITPNSVHEPVMEDVLQLTKAQGIVISEKMASTSWQKSHVTFQYLWPEELEYEGNNDSLVLLMEVGAHRFLFTGDLEAEGEAQLVKKYPQLLRNITLLKAGHHGSKTSSSEDFIKLLNPALTLFTAGKNNRYNHPAQEVVERFEKLNLAYLIVGKEGTIQFSVRNDAIKKIQ